jgi:protein-S-isoprenylcysteine O-methyltransferase Ste14
LALGVLVGIRHGAEREAVDGRPEPPTFTSEASIHRTPDPSPHPRLRADTEAHPEASSGDMAGLLRNVLSIAVLPGAVLGVIPSLLLWRTGGFVPRWPLPVGWLAVGGGGVLFGCGLLLAAHTIRLFILIGRGTLAPWDPTRKLVIEGAYRHVRNPMITGIGTALAGEALLFGAPALAVWLACFVALNHVYFVASEEPGLHKRFGAEYDEYVANVPRWIPRRHPWRL